MGHVFKIVPPTCWSRGRFVFAVLAVLLISVKPLADQFNDQTRFDGNQ